MLVAVLGTVAAACQPVEDFDDLGDAPDSEAPAEEPDRRGAPHVALPTTLAETLERGEDEAVQWQNGARLAEVVVDVTDDGGLAEGRLIYLAPDADRILTVSITREGVRRDRPTLETLGLPPIPGPAVEDLPQLPAATREPADLAAAAAEAFAECGVEGRPATVYYATGAPVAWNADTGRWATPLEWTATVTTEEGAGAVLDPVHATVIDCLAGPG